jgi:hypothetical protein
MRSGTKLRLAVSLVLALTSLSGQGTQKAFTSKKRPDPPPGGSFSGKTIDWAVGKEILGPLGVVTFCGNTPFKSINTIIYWEPTTAWETGYLYGPQNREVFGRHTYNKVGTYTVSVRADAICSNTGYYDVLKGTSTINVK